MIKPKKLINISSVFKRSTRMSDVGRGIGRIQQQPVEAAPAAVLKPKALQGKKAKAKAKPKAKAVAATTARVEKPVSKRAVRRRRIIMCVLAVICIATGLFCASVIFGREADVEVNPEYMSYMSVLTNEEQKSWQDNTQEKGKAYVQMQTRVELDGDNAEIRLINPPYAAYKQKVSIKLVEGDKLLYESDMMLPGTVVEEAELKGLEPGEHAAYAEFIFYDAFDVERGEYRLDLELIEK